MLLYSCVCWYLPVMVFFEVDLFPYIVMAGIIIVTANVNSQWAEIVPLAIFTGWWGKYRTKWSDQGLNSDYCSRLVWVNYISLCYFLWGGGRNRVRDGENIYDIFDNFSGESVNISAFYPYNLLPESRDSYWRYNGSLTTPYCNESVIWTVFTSTVPVSQEQVCNAINFTWVKAKFQTKPKESKKTCTLNLQHFSVIMNVLFSFCILHTVGRI